MDEWQETLSVWRTASHILDRKIQEARADIYETQQEMGRYGKGEIYNMLENHYWIMLEYIEDIKQQGYDMYQEYLEERTKLAKKLGR